MDSGKISILSIEDKNKSEYCITLESMEDIEIGSQVVIINPINCSGLHIIELTDFIRTNMDKEEYYNPYNRNKIEFNDIDTQTLLDKKNEEKQRIHELPKQIYLQLIEILKIISDNKLEILFLPDIIDILEVLMGMLPFLSNLEEACGLEFPRIANMIDSFEKQIETKLLRIKEMIVDKKDDLLNQQEFCPIPSNFKEILVYKFSQLVDLMNKIVLERKESVYSSRILSIFVNLDKIREYIESETYAKLIFQNDNFMESLYNILIVADEEIIEIYDDIKSDNQDENT